MEEIMPQNFTDSVTTALQAAFAETPKLPITICCWLSSRNLRVISIPS